MTDIYLNKEQRETIRRMGTLGLNDQNFELLLDTCDTLERAIENITEKQRAQLSKLSQAAMAAAAAPEVPDDSFFILSVKHSPGRNGEAVWWGPENCGYFTDLRQAGIYSKADVAAKPKYYNDGLVAEAVPVIEIFPDGKVPTSQSTIVSLTVSYSEMKSESATATTTEEHKADEPEK